MMIGLGYWIYSCVQDPDTIKYAIIDGKKIDITNRHKNILPIKVVPKQQKFMRNLITRTEGSFSDEPTSIEKKSGWIKASKELCSSKQFDAFGPKTNWFGVVEAMYLQDNGEMSLKVDIDYNRNAAWDSRVSDHLRDVFVKLKEGDIVRFSGNFQRGNMYENECLAAGMDSNPELTNENFTFSFTKLEKIPTQTVEVD